MTYWAAALAALKLLVFTTSVVAGDVFTCQTAGLIGKSGSCNEYYMCVDFGGNLFSRLFQCEGSYLFDDKRQVCVRAEALTSPAECRRYSPSREVSSADSVAFSRPSVERSHSVSTGEKGEKRHEATDSPAVTFGDSQVEGTTETPTVESSPGAFTEIHEGGGIGEDGRLDSSGIGEDGRLDSRRIGEDGRLYSSGIGEDGRLDSRRIGDDGRLDSRRIGEDGRLDSRRIGEDGRLDSSGIGEDGRLDSRGIGEDGRLDSRGIGEDGRLDSRGIGEDGRLDSRGIGEDGRQTVPTHFTNARNISNETIPNGNFSDSTQVILSLCDQMNSAEDYFALVASSPFVRKSLEYQTKYNEIIQQYNIDIEKAHSNSHLWRRGRSIPLGLKRSHKKANEYERNFQRKFDIYKEQKEIKASQTITPDVLQRIEMQIQELTHSITREQQILTTTKVVALRNFLEESINSTKREIDRLQAQKNPNSEETLLRVLVSFLRFVKDDAAEVESQVTQVLEKMGTLLENIQVDAQDYEKLGNAASTGLKTLEQESEKINNELRWNEKFQDQLDVQWKGTGGLLYDLRHTESQVRKEIDEREKKLDVFLEKKKICWLGGMIQNYINENSTKEQIKFACESILRFKGVTILDVDAETARLDELHDQMKLIQQNQTNAVKELSSIIPQRTSLSDTLPKGQRLGEIEFELYNLNFHDNHLKKLQHGVATARESVLILQQEFQKLQAKFSSIVAKLQEMSDSANGALDDVSQVGQRESIETELEELKTSLQNLVLNNVNKCL